MSETEQSRIRRILNETHPRSNVEWEYSTMNKFLEAYELIAGDIDALKGVSILDLGCGSVSSTDELIIGDRTFEPWLPRALVALGAHVTGIDRGDLSHEGFKGFQMDLGSITPRKPLPLGDSTFDVVHFSKLLDSPSLSPVAQVMHPDEDETSRLERLGDTLLFESLRVLKYDGILFAGRAQYARVGYSFPLQAYEMGDYYVYQKK